MDRYTEINLLKAMNHPNIVNYPQRPWPWTLRGGRVPQGGPLGPWPAAPQGPGPGPFGPMGPFGDG